MTATSVGMRCPECAKQKTKIHTLASLQAEPRVTYVLIALCVMAFIADSVLSASLGGGGVVQRQGALIGIGVDAQGPYGVAEGEYWRLITGGFLHGGLLHIGFNMYILYWLGTMLEPSLGHVRFLSLYLASLLAGSFGALLLNPTDHTVGASGAVFGLMGAAFVMQRARGIDPMQTGIGMVLLLNLGLSFLLPGISIGGHLGGLVGGGLAALAIERIARVRSPWPTAAVCAAVGAVSVAGSVWASLAERAELTAAIAVFLGS